MNTKGSVGGTGISAEAPHALYRFRPLIVVLAAMLLPVLASAATGSNPPPGNPPLASLQIEIWPEYDRPAAALVILRGEIAASVALPAAVSLRIPATSGGPVAVAYSSDAGGKNLNSKYDRVDAGNFIMLKFNLAERFFHVEFYDPIPAGAPGRSFTYMWPGDLAVDRLNVVLQEPATASGLSVQPALDSTELGPDGLRYRSAELGPLQAGKPLEVILRYTKTDSRTSTEILNPKVPVPPPLPIAGPSKAELTMWLAAVVALLVLGGIAISAWWYRRKSVSEPHPSGAGFCRKCKAPSRSGDRFCSKCGAPLA